MHTFSPSIIDTSYMGGKHNMTVFSMALGVTTAMILAYLHDDQDI